MSQRTRSPARCIAARGNTALPVLLAALLLAPVALAVDVIVSIRDSVVFFRSQVDGRIAAIGEPGTKAEQTELKNLESASSALGDVAADLAPLSVPEGLFETGILKDLGKVGGLIEKSGTSDGAVLTGFQALFTAVDEWGDALSDLYDSYLPALTAKEAAKTGKLAQTAYDLYGLAMDYVADGELGKATKTGAKALGTFAKATLLARKYASD